MPNYQFFCSVKITPYLCDMKKIIRDQNTLYDLKQQVIIKVKAAMATGHTELIPALSREMKNIDKGLLKGTSDPNESSKMKHKRPNVTNNNNVAQ